MDLSFENYTPPEKGENLAFTPKTKYEEFLEAVIELAKQKDVEYVVATRNGLYSSVPGDSLVLKELETKAIEINGRPENLRTAN